MTIVANKLSSIAERAVQWSAQNAPEIGRKLRACARQARLIETSSEFRQAVAVYGPSQAGKSYLVGALASPEDGELQIDFQGRQTNFLEEINPAGGKESSGLVSRFTLQAPQGTSQAPVAVRLLSAMDVICILANSWFRDFKLPTPPETLDNLLRQLDNLAETQQEKSLVSREEIEALQDYFDENFRGEKQYAPFERGENSENAWWNKLAEQVENLNSMDLVSALAPLWGGQNSPFTPYAKTLLEARGALPSDNVLFCGVEALIPRENSILDVAALSNPLGGMLGFYDAQGKNCGNISRHIAAALVAELILPLSEARWDFQKEKSDILDFPGARSREVCREFPFESARVPHFFLRGKVDRLFTLYQQNMDITAIVLCIGDSNQEVKTLPDTVTSWIEGVLGNTPEARSQSPESLFMVLTKTDLQLGYLPGSSYESPERWNSRLEASVIQFFGQTPWLKNWRQGQSVFNNIQFVRKPPYGDVYNVISGGKEDSQMRDSFKENLPRLKEGYTSAQNVQNFVRNSEQAFEALLKQNDGGISYLSERLLPIMQLDPKENLLKTRLEDCFSELLALLQPYFHDGSAEIEARETERRLEGFVRVVGMPLFEKKRFGAFLLSLGISAEKAAEEWRRFSSEEAKASDKKNAEKMLLGALAGKVEESKNEKDRFDHFAERLIKIWQEVCREELLGEAPEAKAKQAWLSVDNPEFASFLELLFKLVEERALAKKLAAKLRAQCEGSGPLVRSGEKPGLLSAEILTSFVTWLGWNPLPAGKENIDGRPNLGTGKPIFVTPEDPAPYFERFSLTKPALYPYIDNLGKSGEIFQASWIAALAARYKEAGPQYNIVENEKLHKILEEIKENRA